MANKNQQLIEELWQLAYQTFENRPGDGVRTDFATKAQSNEVQFRLMKNIAELKAPSAKISEKICGSIEADIQLAHAMGWMTNETNQRMLELLTSIKE